MHVHIGHGIELNSTAGGAKLLTLSCEFIVLSAGCRWNNRLVCCSLKLDFIHKAVHTQRWNFNINFGFSIIFQSSLGSSGVFMVQLVND